MRSSLSLHAASQADANTQAAATASQDTTDAAAPAPAEVLAVAVEAAAPRTTFADLGLSEDLLRAITEKGYVHPTPIQEQAIPIVLQGRDVMGVAQTGTGKTASFTLPMCEILSGSRARARMPRSLILEPTRELALQVAENFVQYGKYLKLNHALLIGGESMSDQKEVLMRGVDVLIATPGRLIDMFERGGLLLSDTRILVVDEADRMLDMGFIPDVERIVSMLPSTRQTLLFSATMAKEIRRLADAFLQNPKEIKTAAAASVATTITSGLVIVDEEDKRRALRQLIKSEEVQNALIFCNRKRDVDILFKSLQRHGFSVGALHGDLPQSARFSTLEKFRANELRILVCSDVAARGIDIGGLSHVFNFDVPHHSEDYVHRIGRTGRAGREGRAFTFATPGQQEAVVAIEKLTGKPIPQIQVEGFDLLGWSEASDSRGKGRGRGRGKDKPAAKDSVQSAPAEARNDGPSKSRHKPKDKPAETQAEARSPEPRQAEPRQAEPRATEDRQPRHAEPRAKPDRGDQGARPNRDRGGDLGPSVVGFGDEIPAFMLVRRRSQGVASVDAPGFVAGEDRPADTDAPEDGS
ncbi:DEAD/DEAH box helicase [Acidisoma silvae]|uniref:DEAD/DEAH box helicase n=1 Tax=Acidisoma silvae TaxID=2802396 RepID=UPI003873867B